MKGKKKDKKSKKDKSLNLEPESQETSQESNQIIDDGLGGLLTPQEPKEEEPELSESQKQKKEQLDSVRSKISRILKSGNIEIVDENTGDEYDVEETSDSEKKKQQDYDSLKSIFGGKDKNKKQELTLTIDDFDYTYIGKYVEDLDLIHKKNIKKIKLPSKALKIVRRVAIVLVLIGVLIGGAIFAINFTKEPIYFLDKVTLSQDSQTYFVDENFDFTGLYLYLTYSNGKNSYTTSTPLTISYFSQANSRGNFNAGRNSITFTGGTEVTLSFAYGGKLCSMAIEIERKDNIGITAKYTNGLFELRSGDLINSKNLIMLVDYENYNSEVLDLDTFTLKVDGVTQTYDKGTSSILLNRNISHSSVIEITYNSYSVNLTYNADAKGIIEVNYVA